MYGRFDSGIVNKKSRQAIIDAFLNKKASLDYMQQIKETAGNDMDDDNHSSRLSYKNLVSSINNSSGA